MKRFEGRTAIITGGSRGIGLAIAKRLVTEGARVVITGRTEQSLTDAVEALGGPDLALGVAGHADDVGHQHETTRKALDAFGSVDLFVSNTGINPVYGDLLALVPSAARKVVDVNVFAALGWIRVVHEGWMAQSGGAIVAISSLAGLKPAHGIGMYGASKAMLTHVTQQLAVELAPHVRVNAIAPAVVKTQFASALYEGREAEVASAYPLARLGAAEDVAGATAFLLSEDAAWITGQLLVVDGGLTLTGGV